MEKTAKKNKIKVTYRLAENWNSEDSRRRVDQAFDILFEATLESEGWKKYKAKKPR